MTTGNRTNEPTPEQVDAAAKAIADCHNPGMFEKYPENWRVEARAALVAAQGAAPQTEAYDHCCQHPKCPGGSLCCCVSEQRLRDCWNQWREEVAGDSKQAFRDGYQAGQNDPAPWLTAPVLPSSGVDEGALAERAARSVRSAVEVVVREVMPDAAIAARVTEELEEAGLLASSLNQDKIEAHIKKLNGKGQHARKY